MKPTIPAWAMKRAAADDYDAVRDAHSRGTLDIEWPELKELREWSRLRGWPAPRFRFRATWLARLFESQKNFACALEESGIELHIPLREYTLSLDSLREFDALYAERSPTTGLPNAWGLLVEELREIRRAVVAGVVVQVEGGPKLRTWGGFYAWAHGRYHALEDGYDNWIGDDR
jgi:hypothetical protein